MLLMLALAALIALAAAGCGGGDGDSTQATTSAAGGAQAQAARQDGGDRGEEKHGGDDKGGAAEAGGDKGGEPSTAGEGSASFRTRGGDNSIQDFGDEADDSERETAEAVVVAYLGARAKAAWAKSCEYLAKAAIQPLEQLTQSSPRFKGKGCGAIIGTLSARLPAAGRANPVTQGVASLRVEGDRAFALFHGPHGADFFLPMVKEDGSWKVGAVGASEFP